MESYAALPYDARPITQAHPDRLAVIARMMGLTPAPPEQSRILDLGCADGSHLLALAIEYPDSHCVGVDSSAEQVERGRQAAEELGVKNLSLRIADLGTALDGEFDYVSAHGVYSWVDAPTRDRLLATFRRCLAPTGVGYLSYEVFPGAYPRFAVRNLLLPHVQPLGSAAMGDRFRSLARAIGDALPADQPGAAALKAELARAARASDSAVAHDWCSDAHEPVYSRDFAAHLSRHELEFVADTPLFRSSASSLTPAARTVLGELGRTRDERQQGIDALANTAYRESLVVRAGRALRSDPDFAADLETGRLSAFVTLPDDGSSGPTLRVKNYLGTTASVSDPAIKAAVLALAAAAPGSLTLGDLAGDLDEPRRRALARGLFELYSAGFVDLRRDPPRCTGHPGERPQASHLARWQARRGPTLTNQAHYLVQIPDARVQKLIELLDGTRDRARLVADWRSHGTPAEAQQYVERLGKLGLLIA